MATNAENIGAVQLAIESADEILGAMVAATQVIQEMQDTLGPVKEDHDESSTLEEALERMADAKGQTQDIHEKIGNARSSLETFLGSLENTNN